MTGPGPLFLVDDNPMDVELTLLALRNHRPANPVIVARDGQELLDWIPRWEAREPRPCAILLDINMPRVGGIEALERLKSHPTLRTVPVVMLTTSAEPGDVHAAYHAHANSYIIKPVDFDKFSAAIGQLQSYWTGLNHPPEPVES